MPPGSKKRKALKKKQQEEQESIGAGGANNKGFNGHGIGNISGHDEHGSQDERETDGNLSSPGSQGNDEFGERDPSPSPPQSSGLGRVTVKEQTDITRAEGVKGEDFVAVGRGTDHEENGVDKPPNSFPENLAHKSRKLASQEAVGTSTLEIAPAVDSDKPVSSSSASKVVMSDKNEQVESSTDSNAVQQKSGETEEKHRLKEAKEVNIPGSAAETSKEIKRGKESEVPECSEERSLMPSGPPVVRTSWLSCCGLFDVIAGSER